MRTNIARTWFGVVGGVGVVGVVMSFVLWMTKDPGVIVQLGGGHGDPEQFAAWYSRIPISIWYFTILSNIIVFVTNLLLAVRFERTSTVFRAFRLFGLIAITVTGLVYNLYLARLVHPEGAALVENDMVHVFVPIFTFLGWLIFGPRIPFKWRYVWWSMLFGFLWILFTFVHGAVLKFYPYPFLDAITLGYPRAILNTAALLVASFLLALFFLGLDKILPPKQAQQAQEPVPGPA